MSKLTVHNLVLSKTCKDATDQSRITILKGINATFEYGKLNAIMGANGSGKSTFLDILCGYCDKTTKTSGKILLDGAERNLDDWFSNVTYIAQESYEINNQTVRSMIQFSIDLKNVETGGSAKIEDYLWILHDLYLEDVIDSRVEVLSGGERRRALIASELVMERKILILDEPTSDLDSHLALNLIYFLKRIAIEKNFIVIFTIHQPSDQIFKLFDNLLFINNGKVLFDGEAVKIGSFLSDHGIVRPEEWAISEFIFEAFYSESLFDEVKILDEKTELYKREVDAKSDEILKLAVLTSKNTEQYKSQELSFKKAFYIAKRRLLAVIRSKLAVMCLVLVESATLTL